jgi:hypothetical protein
MEVVAATKNPGEPWGRRSYHRPDCPHVTKKGHVPGYWTRYPSSAAARADKRRLCEHCQTERIP